MYAVLILGRLDLNAYAADLLVKDTRIQVLLKRFTGCETWPSWIKYLELDLSFGGVSYFDEVDEGRVIHSEFNE